MEGAFRLDAVVEAVEDTEADAVPADAVPEAEVPADAARAVLSALLPGRSWYVAMDRQTASTRTSESIFLFFNFV